MLFVLFRKNFTGYSLESRLHFRIHSDLMNLTGKKADELVGKKMSDSPTGIEIAEEAYEEAEEAFIETSTDFVDTIAVTPPISSSTKL